MGLGEGLDLTKNLPASCKRIELTVVEVNIDELGVFWVLDVSLSSYHLHLVLFSDDNSSILFNETLFLEITALVIEESVGVPVPRHAPHE